MEVEAARTQNEQLLACCNQLREEASELKNEILRQSGCDCPIIRSYLSIEAQRALNNMMRDAQDRYDRDTGCNSGNDVAWNEGETKALRSCEEFEKEQADSFEVN